MLLGLQWITLEEWNYFPSYICKVTDFVFHMWPPIIIPLVIQSVDIAATKHCFDLLKDSFIIFPKFDFEYQSNFRQVTAVFIDGDAKASFPINETDNVMWI